MSLFSTEIISAVRDPDCASEAFRSIREEAIALWSSREIHSIPSVNQWLALVAIPEFPICAKERIDVLSLLATFDKETQILPYFSDCLYTPNYHEREAFAARCLLGCGAFRRGLVDRTRRRGAPGPNWYSSVGKYALVLNGKNEVAQHFREWAGFLEEYLSFSP